MKSNQCSPGGMTLKPYSKCVSVDGDADRIVYSFVDEKNKFYLLDGDRIATLGIKFKFKYKAITFLVYLFSIFL